MRDTRTLVRDAALRSGLPPALVESVARVESALRPEAVSPKGALGVMQLMPATARALDADPHDTAQNIDAGARLLRELLIKYDGDVVKALSAYNAGEGAVDRYRGMPPYPETQDYVDKVIRTYVKRRRRNRPAQLRLGWPLPAHDRFPRSGHFVHFRGAGGVRSGLDQLRRLLDFLGDGNHGVGEQIQLALAFGLSGLDHQRAFDDQREATVYGWKP